jgi:hypothetical protein
MSTTPASFKPSWFHPKYLLFVAIGLMLAYVIPHDESFLVHPKDPIWQHDEPFKWWLLPHGIAWRVCSPALPDAVLRPTSQSFQ